MKNRKFLDVMSTFMLALIVLAAIFLLRPVQAEAATIKRGTCGDNLTWTLDDIGTLTISGTGDMSWSGYWAPWHGSRAFVRRVVIGNGVTSIGSDAFNGCYTLTRMTIPDNVTYIGSDAFYECTGLVSVTIGNGVRSIGSYAFYKCTNLESVTIGNGVRVIGSDAFAYCDSLASVTLPDSLTSIYESAFFNCSSLASVIIPDSVISLYEDAFNNCDSLISVIIGDRVETIGEQAFYNCDNLASVIIGDSVTTIGEQAFYDCDSLVSVTIPTSVTTIDYDAFYNSDKLTDGHVYYAGNQTQWNAINIKFNDILVYATIHYNHIHDYTLLPATTVTPTCTKNGYIEYTCAWGETYRHTLGALGHISNSAGVVRQPSCTGQGYTTYTCSRCGVKSFADYFDALGHDYSGTVTTFEPTCTRQGYTATSCTRCNSVEKTNYIDSVAHKLVLVPAVEPTCEQTGLTVGTACQMCGLVGVVQKEVAALGGNCDFTADSAVCGNCGYVRADVSITNVVLRPSCAGLYFKGAFTFGAHETATRYGIAVSLYNKLPVADDSDETSLYTVGENSVLISNILGEGKNGEDLIYARPYVLLDDGTYIYGEVVVTNLKSVVEALDATIFDNLSTAQETALADMYRQNTTVMQDWLIPKIKEFA